MVFNTTFNDISVISWWSVLLVEEIGILKRKPPTCCKSLSHKIVWSIPHHEQDSNSQIKL